MSKSFHRGSLTAANELQAPVANTTAGIWDFKRNSVNVVVSPCIFVNRTGQEVLVLLNGGATGAADAGADLLGYDLIVQDNEQFDLSNPFGGGEPMAISHVSIWVPTGGGVVAGTNYTLRGMILGQH